MPKQHAANVRTADKTLEIETAQPGENAGNTRRRLLACLAALFVITGGATAQAGLDTEHNDDGGVDYTVTDTYDKTVGKGKDTASNSNVVIEEGATLQVVDNHAISVHDYVAIDIKKGALVFGSNIHSGGGDYGTGRNVIESNSHSTITIGEEGVALEDNAKVIKTGSSGNAEAINVHGINNVIRNYGTISAAGSAAIWFQDVVHTTEEEWKNVVDNYGLIERVGGGNVIGTSAGNGIIFHNRHGAEVIGDLKFASGDDELYLEAGSSITGNIDGGGGHNSLRLDGDTGTGVLAGAITHFQTLEKIGDGVWNITGPLTGFESTDVRDGILRLSGDNSGYTGTLVVHGDDDSDVDRGILEAKTKSLPTHNKLVEGGNVYLNYGGILRFTDNATDNQTTDGVGIYDGVIAGDGSVEMSGDGIVALTNTNTYTGPTRIHSGTLQLGDGTDGNGRIPGEGVGSDVMVYEGAALAFNHAEGSEGEFTNFIRGDGKVIQRGENELHLTYVVKNEFKGGTEIESGSVLVTTPASYGEAKYGEKEGHITFTGDNVEKTLTLRTDDTNATLHIHSESGEQNVVIIEGDQTISGVVNTQGEGGAFMVDGGSSMTVEVVDGSLTLEDNEGSAGDNDIFVAENGELRLVSDKGSEDKPLGDWIISKSGIAGGGSLIIDGLVAVRAESNGMGTVDIATPESVLHLAEGFNFNIEELHVRESAVLAGGGVYSVDHAYINGVLSPDSYTDDKPDVHVYDIGRLGMNGETVTLGDTFRYVYDVVAPNNPSDNETNTQNDLFYLGAQNVTIERGGAVAMYTTEEVDGKYKKLETGKYLLVDSDGASFFEANGTPLTDDTIKNIWSVEVNGKEVTNSSPRNSFDLTLGSSSDGQPDDQIWLDYEHNSLTMNWTGSGSVEFPVTGNWNYGGETWQSLQASATGGRENIFEDGDEVAIGGSVTLTLGDPEDDDKEVNPVVSSLIVGATVDDDGAVKIDGQGSITADKDSAVGKYKDLAVTDPDHLEATGKLLKYGAGTLTLANKTDSGNLFKDGIDIYEGEVRFRDANVLFHVPDGSTDDLTSAATVTFKNQTVDGGGNIAGADETAKGLVLEDESADVEKGREVLLVNRFVVEEQIGDDSRLHGVHITNASSADMVLTTDYANAGGDKVAIEVGAESLLKVVADGHMDVAEGGNIVFEENDTDILLGDQAILMVSGNKDVFIKSGMQSGVGAADNEVDKLGNGALWIQADSTIAGKTDIGGGTMRIGDGFTYISSDSFTVEASSLPTRGVGTVAGGGTVLSNNITIAGNVSPDSFTSHEEVLDNGAERFGTLTLDVGGDPNGRITFVDGFTIALDLDAPTVLGGDDLPTNTQDLLILKSEEYGKNPILASGTIAIDLGDATLESGEDYLLVKSDKFFVAAGPLTPLTDADINGIGAGTGMLTATLNGRSADAAGGLDGSTVRGSLALTLYDDDGGKSDDDKENRNIWLTHTLNSLTMEWALAAGEQEWSFYGTEPTNWLSLQGGVDEKDQHFMNGDLVYVVTGIAAAEIKMDNAATGKATSVTVSGLVVGKNVGTDGTNGAEVDGDITISGAGGITALEDSAFGKYVGALADNPKLTPTGKLEKYGEGTLTLANTGGNYFEKGVEINNGTIKLAQADVIATKDGFTDAAMTITFMRGTDDDDEKSLVFSSYDDDEGEPVTSQTLNTSIIIVEGKSRNNTVTAEIDTTLYGAVDGTGVYKVGPVIDIKSRSSTPSSLTLTAAGGNITLNNQNNDLTSTPDQKADILVESGAELTINGTGNVYTYKGINSEVSAAKLFKFGSGTLQIMDGENNFKGETTVSDDGTFRVLQDVSFGNTLSNFSSNIFTLDSGGTNRDDKATLAGAGTIRASETTLNGIISPDRIDLTKEVVTLDADLDDSEKFGVLTIQGNAAAAIATLGQADDPFIYDYDTDGPTTQRETPFNQSTLANDDDLAQDLLRFSGYANNNVTLYEGVVNLRTAEDHLHPESGMYLLIASDGTIMLNDTTQNETGLNSLLTLQINGGSINQESPRTELEFHFNDDDFSASTLTNNEIWLGVEHNTLQMDLQESEATDGTISWNTVDENWLSRQYNQLDTNQHHETRFRNGDFVYVAPTGALTVDLGEREDEDDPTQVIVSGLTTGKTSAGAVGDGDVTFTGDYGILALKENNSVYTDVIVGQYAETDDDEDIDDTLEGAQQFYTTGKFEKYGSGVTAFTNGVAADDENDILEIGNLFTNGIDIHAGVVAFQRESQIGVGDGAAISFLGDEDDESTIRPLNTVELSSSDFVVGDGATGFFDVGEVGEDDDKLMIGLLLNDGTTIADVGAGGDIVKTGVGVMQLAGTDDGSYEILGTATVSEGELRTVGERDDDDGSLINQSTLTAGKVTLEADAALGGGGVFVAVDTGAAITINGIIRPDSVAFDADSDLEEDAKESAGTLTLNAEDGTITLGKGFVLEYDALEANLSPGTPDIVKDNNYDKYETANDLLTLNSTDNVTLDLTEADRGVVQLSPNFTSGKYLLIDSDQTIGVDGLTDVALNQVLIAKVGEGELVTDPESPRGGYAFLFGNIETTGPANSQIWLDIEKNSLTMGRSTGGDWSDDKWRSEQTGDNGHQEKSFLGGDHAVLSNPNAAGETGEITIGIGRHYVASGLTVDGSGDIRLQGAGGLTVTTNHASIEGLYLDSNDPEGPKTPLVEVTGKYEKSGGGTFYFENTGGNHFDEGMWLEDGVTAFNDQSQILTRKDDADPDSDKGINFVGDEVGLRATFTGSSDEHWIAVNNNINIDDDSTANLIVDEDVVLAYQGNIEGSVDTTIQKQGEGVLRLEAPSHGEDPTDISAFAGAMDIQEGELALYANYGDVLGFEVQRDAVLSGIGALGANASGGYIRAGGTLAPSGYDEFRAGNTDVIEALTIAGDLTFVAGSNFDVTISQDKDNLLGDGKYTPLSDWIQVTNSGTVTIESGANLNVAIDLWNNLSLLDFNADDSSYFTIIDAGTVDDVDDPDAQFTLSLSKNLPRGVQINQGWRGDDFQLWFSGNGQGYRTLGGTPNEQEIGENVDDLLNDPNISDIHHYLDGLDDPDAQDALNQLTGDIVANTLESAMKRPWRSAFNRFDRDPISDPCAPAACVDPCAPSPLGGQIWAEFQASHSRARYDGNAFSHKVDRLGVGVGYDHRVSSTTTLGVTFNYSNPRLKQETGKVRWDDYGIGVYGRTWLGDLFELRGFFGYSYQEYKIDRRVRLDGYEAGDNRDAHAGFHDNYSSRTSGHSLAGSLEITRPFAVSRNFQLRPVAAFDYEQVWMKGFREKGESPTALSFEKSNYKQYMARVGLHTQVALGDRVDLQARAQYVRQLNGNGYAATGVRFTNAEDPNQRAARIRGVDIGKNSVNLGIGLDIKLNRAKTGSLYVNYDADIYRRQTTHAGEAGIMFRF